MTDAAATAALDNLELIGMSYHTAPLHVLERLVLAPEEIQSFYERVRSEGVLRDALVLSTCNRTEVYASPSGETEVSAHVLGLLREVAGVERVPVDDEAIYHRSGRGSAHHLLRVACGLDSMVLGEAQILGQVKDAYETSLNHLEPSAGFDRLMQAAFKVGKRSRSTTEIGRGAVSVASAAVHLATRIFADLSAQTVVVIGAGDTGRLVAEHFEGQHPKRLIVVNRTLERAQQVAQSLGAEAMPWDRLPEALAAADIAASAVQSAEPIISGELMTTVLRGRAGRALALLDLGLPRNVAPEVGSVTDVFLQDLDSLKQVVDGNLARRKREIPRVEDLIDIELERVMSWGRIVEVGPLIAAFRESVERVRAEEVARAGKQLSEAEREAVDRATRAVVNKLMHGPMTSIKEVARQQEQGAERLQIIRQIFRNLNFDESDE